jgi:hypothetical protein
VLPEFGVIPRLPDHLQFWLLLALGAVVFVPVTLLSRPENMTRLVRYYVMTRPIGWWQPVHREAVRRGLIEEVSRKTEPRPLIRRAWTPDQADEWTREDWIAVILSPLVFAGLMIGITRLLLLQLDGLWLLLGAILGAGLIYWVIDPKLRAVSSEYEAQQAQYIQQLEQRLRWQEEEAV